MDLQGQIAKGILFFSNHLNVLITLNETSSNVMLKFSLEFNLPFVILSSVVNVPINSVELMKSKSGGIILTGHLGNWEYIGPMLSIHNIKSAGVALIQKNSQSDRFFNELRISENMKVIPVNSGSKVMIEHINEGYYLGLVSDQNAGERGTINNFFNMPTSTPKGAAILNTKKNIPIIIIFIIMNSDYNYSIYSKELITQGNSKTQKIININQAYNDELEKIIIKHPEQYFWFHKKWDKKHYE